MTTKLVASLKREVLVNGEPHTVLIEPSGLKVTKKGCRNGVGMSWADFLNQAEAPVIVQRQNIPVDNND